MTEVIAVKPEEQQVAVEEQAVLAEQTFRSLDVMQQHGINVADIKKLKEAGFHTVASVATTMRKELCNIKGLTDAKVDKLMEAAALIEVDLHKFEPCDVMQRKEQQYKFKLSTGSRAFDEILGGGIESCSITELFSEARCGKTQVAHTLSVLAQMPREHGGANGKVLYIDTEGAFRPERIAQIAMARGLPAEIAMANVVVARCYSSSQILSLLGQASSLVVGSDVNFALLVVDSIMALFRVDYSGRGELAERQQKLGKVLSKIHKFSVDFNVAVLLTNQVMANPDSGACAFAAQLPKPIGGHVLAHWSQTRVMLRKRAGAQRLAKIYDSPSMPEAEAVFEIGDAGVIEAAT